MKKLSFFPVKTSTQQFFSNYPKAILDNEDRVLVGIQIGFPVYKMRRILRMANFSFKLMSIYKETKNEKEVLRLLRAEITVMS